jgi:hypothetical protein
MSREKVLAQIKNEFTLLESREKVLSESIAKILKILHEEENKQAIKKKVSEVMLWLISETTIDSESFVEILKEHGVTPENF